MEHFLWGIGAGLGISLGNSLYKFTGSVFVVQMLKKLVATNRKKGR